MNMDSIEELNLIADLRTANQRHFSSVIKRMETTIQPIMINRGFKKVNRSERTVLFTFGAVTFSRDRWYKNGECVVPLDITLGLEKNVRFSPELMYQLTWLATCMSYRQVVEVVAMMYGIDITKDTVLKAIKYAGQLLDDRRDFTDYEEDEVEEGEKRSPALLFIEGDGVIIKTTNKDTYHTDLAHFIVHEGVELENGNRHRLVNKKEFIAPKVSEARAAMITYIHRTYKITKETILVTTSDGGKGYTPYSFKEIASELCVKRHEHFYDPYHVNQLIKDNTGKFDTKLVDVIYQAISLHDRKKLRTVLDTMESLLETDEAIDKFLQFSRKLLNNFQYTIPAKKRGLNNISIGIMESQHRKVTYRMKHRGMYWSKKGADTMSQLILLRREGNLRDLFFGEWRDEYERYKSLEMQSVESVLGLSNKSVPHTIPTGVKVHLGKSGMTRRKGS